jgi:hypothetical protein
VIKQFTFANRHADASSDTFVDHLREVLRARAGGTSVVRPCRSALCTVVPGEGPRQRHDGVGIEWFEDSAHLARFEEWRASAAPVGKVGDILAVADGGDRAVVVASEIVQRGADWLEARWHEGGVKFKHMAIALRAAGLTPAEFSRRWRAHAGTVSRGGRSGGASGDLVIPDEVRGLAYVQDHPLLRDDAAWAYDAVNEVYFDDEVALRRRSTWFEENVGREAQEDLVGDRWFLCVREELLGGEL